MSIVSITCLAVGNFIATVLVISALTSAVLGKSAPGFIHHIFFCSLTATTMQTNYYVYVSDSASQAQRRLISRLMGLVLISDSLQGSGKISGIGQGTAMQAHPGIDGGGANALPQRCRPAERSDCSHECKSCIYKMKHINNHSESLYFRHMYGLDSWASLPRPSLCTNVCIWSDL